MKEILKQCSRIRPKSNRREFSNGQRYRNESLWSQTEITGNQNLLSTKHGQARLGPGAMKPSDEYHKSTHNLENKMCFYTFKHW